MNHWYIHNELWDAKVSGRFALKIFFSVVVEVGAVDLLKSLLNSDRL